MLGRQGGRRRRTLRAAWRVGGCSAPIRSTRTRPAAAVQRSSASMLVDDAAAHCRRRPPSGHRRRLDRGPRRGDLGHDRGRERRQARVPRPPPGAGEHAEATRAALENLARTTSIEWARYAIRPTTITPGAATTAEEVGGLVAFLASPAGDPPPAAASASARRCRRDDHGQAPAARRRTSTFFSRWSPARACWSSPRRPRRAWLGHIRPRPGRPPGTSARSTTA